jgi:ribulose-phosphate 3-epimerase
VSPANAKQLVEAGAEILVAGSAVFKADDPSEIIKAMR